MKALIRSLPFLFLLFLAGCAGSREATKEEMNHEFILSLPGVQKQQAYEMTLKWLANTFRSAKAVVEYQNKENGSIIGNGMSRMKVEAAISIEVEIAFTMNIDIRDEKVRIRFVNLEYIPAGATARQPFRDIVAYHHPAHHKFSEIVESLSQFIQKKDVF
ncbi:MAG: DUF4468 domain-containing protein [Ignavibacteriales bacterium]|nr:DUF4468 domain-containing protein [Ignavibacteriales bacterium]